MNSVQKEVKKNDCQEKRKMHKLKKKMNDINQLNQTLESIENDSNILKLIEELKQKNFEPSLKEHNQKRVKIID